MKKYLDIIVFYVISLGIMCLFTSLFVINKYIFFLVIPFVMFAPLIGVLVANKLITKRNLSDFGIKKGEISLKLVALAIVFPFIVIFISIIIAAPFFKIDLTLSEFFKELQEASQRYNVPYKILLYASIIQFIIAPFFNTIFAFGEESGWRGFLLQRLMEESDIDTALILTGILWGIWHWPLILVYGYNYASTLEVPSIEIRIIGSLLFLLFTVALGIFLAWLRFKSDSVLIPSLAHGAINAYLGLGSYIILVDHRLIGYPSGTIPIISLTILAIPFYLKIKKELIKNSS